ncbi:MAG: helix-turn-helix transcriptional regulator [Deltaproteobacteria bacterium]
MRKSLDGVLRAIGRRVAEIRAAGGWTQEQLAERLHIATRNFQALERGERNATVGSLLGVAVALRVDVRELFDEPSTPAPGPGRPRRSAAGEPVKRRVRRTGKARTRR